MPAGPGRTAASAREDLAGPLLRRPRQDPRDGHPLPGGIPRLHRPQPDFIVPRGKIEPPALALPEKMITFAVPISRDTYWRDARVAEEARLESVCTPKGYREFESRSLRKNPLQSVL